MSSIKSPKKICPKCNEEGVSDGVWDCGYGGDEIKEFCPKHKKEFLLRKINLGKKIDRGKFPIPESTRYN